MPLCDSSENVRAGRAAIAFARRPAAWFDGRCFRGLPVLVHEVYRCVWGLRLRRTAQKLALSPLFVLPTANVKKVGARNDLFADGYPPHPILCLRFAAYLTIGLAQDSRPSGSLVLTRKALSSSSRVEDWRDAPKVQPICCSPFPLGVPQ